MADISDIEQAVANFVTSTLYPSGASQCSIGALCRVYRGWPNSGTLNADLSAGVVNITVVTDNDSGRTTTRYLPEWHTNLSQPGIAASATGQTITLSGSPLVGDVVGALIDGVAYAYRIQAGDTVDLIASNIVQLIQVDRPATVHGSVLAIPGAGSVQARVVSDSATSFESRRQEKDIRVICWCPNPPIRDAVAAAIDLAMDQMSFLILPDDTLARVAYKNTASYDQAQNALLYRRDLLNTIEYPTVTIFEQPSMLFGASGINGNITYG
jgi:hypothetical protein